MAELKIDPEFAKRYGNKKYTGSGVNNTSQRNLRFFFQLSYPFQIKLLRFNLQELF